MSRPRVSRLAVGIVTALVAVSASASTAHAGQWVQVSCENPDGSAATNQGWSGASSSNPAYGSTVSAACSPGNPMVALLSSDAPVPVGSAEDADLRSPTGSTLAGGEVTVSGSGAGQGYNASGDSLVLTPVNSYPSGVIYQCASGLTTCQNGDYGFSTSVGLPADAGGDLYVAATCGGDAGEQCNEDAQNGAWSEISVSSADLLLSNSALPTGADFTGTLLSGEASGTAELDFTASEIDGPGIYGVTADVDGNEVFSGVPNDNGGACVAVGTYPGTSALEFDYAQPCLTQEAVSIPVDTTSLKNGKHELTVSVSDAAGNSATVEDAYFTVDNTVKTPLPVKSKGVAKVRVRFLATPVFVGAVTRLSKLSHSSLPRGARVSLSVSGPDHPQLKHRSATGDKQVKRLLSDLSRLSFHSGDTLTFTVRAPGRRTEKVRVTFGDHTEPTVKLLSS